MAPGTLIFSVQRLPECPLVTSNDVYTRTVSRKKFLERKNKKIYGSAVGFEPRISAW